MQLPTQNPITQGKHGAYNAVDFGAWPDPWFYAPEDGVISGVGESDATCGNKLYLQSLRGKHGFCHIEPGSYKVSNGQKVTRGTKLAKMGYTGFTQPDNVPEGTHLHWIFNNGLWIYPPNLVNQSFIKQEEAHMPTNAEQDAEYRQQLLKQIASEVSVDYKDGSDVQQVVTNIRTLYRLINEKDAEITRLVNDGGENFEPVKGQVYKEKGTTL